MHNMINVIASRGCNLEFISSNKSPKMLDALDARIVVVTAAIEKCNTAEDYEEVLPHLTFTETAALVNSIPEVVNDGINSISTDALVSIEMAASEWLQKQIEKNDDLNSATLLGLYMKQIAFKGLCIKALGCGKFNATLNSADLSIMRKYLARHV